MDALSQQGRQRALHQIMPMLKAAAKALGRSVATLLNTYQVDVAAGLQPILSEHVLKTWPSNIFPLQTFPK